MYCQQVNYLGKSSALGSLTILHYTIKNKDWLYYNHITPE